MFNLKFVIISVFFIATLTATASWGPKIKFSFINDLQQVCPYLYIGVDSLATDGYDKDVIFQLNDTTLIEDYDLPPFPPSNILYAYLIKDSTQPFDTYSYVDFKAIPLTDKFFKKYRIYLKWANSPYYEQKVVISWNELPIGIDSAKIRAWEWFDEEQFVDMKLNTSVTLDNQAYKNVDIYVWYNKNHTNIVDNIQKQITIYPNPAIDYININMEKNKNYNFNANYKIYSFDGQIVSSGNIDNNLINIKDIAPSLYFIKIGNTTLPFTKLKN